MGITAVKIQNKSRSARRRTGYTYKSYFHFQTFIMLFKRIQQTMYELLCIVHRRQENKNIEQHPRYEVRTPEWNSDIIRHESLRRITK